MRARRSRKDRLLERAAFCGIVCSAAVRMTGCFLAGVAHHLTSSCYLGEVLDLTSGVAWQVRGCWQFSPRAYIARNMKQLEAPFTAGLLAWVQCGPSYQPRLSDRQMKISVLLGKYAAGWRSSGQHPWLRVPARSTSVCVSDVPAGAELTGGGHFCMLILEREYLGKRWAAASTEERRRYDVAGTHDPFLFHLAAEASARLRCERRLPPNYVESLAHWAASMCANAICKSGRPPWNVRPFSWLPTPRRGWGHTSRRTWARNCRWRTWQRWLESARATLRRLSTIPSARRRIVS